jgi:hypothetical protein
VAGFCFSNPPAAVIMSGLCDIDFVQFAIRVSHCTPMVDRLLRDMSFSEVSSDNLFRMFPLQNALTHYELSLQNILELLRVRKGT